jgi:hypothetical protein
MPISINVLNISKTNPTIIKTSSDGRIIIIGVQTDNNLNISKDYGNTWNKIYFGLLIGFSSSINVELISYNISSSGQFITLLCYNNTNKNNYIIISNDYGNNFQQKKDFQQNPTLVISKSIISISSSYEYQIVCTYNSSSNTYINIYLSNDYGTTFNPITLSSTYYNLNCVAMSSSGKYIIIGTSYNNEQSPYYLSSDYGNTFTKYLSNIPYSDTKWSLINMSANGQYIIGIDSVNNNILTSVDYGKTWNYKNYPYSIVSCEMSANGQYITLLDSDGNIYYSVTPYANLSISNNVNIINDLSLNGRAFINNIVIQF